MPYKTPHPWGTDACCPISAKKTRRGKRGDLQKDESNEIIIAGSRVQTRFSDTKRAHWSTVALP